MQENALISFASTRRPSANYRANHPAQPVTSEVKIGDDWTLYLSSHGQGVTILDHDVVSNAYISHFSLSVSSWWTDNLCQLYLWGEILHTAYFQVIEMVPLRKLFSQPMNVESEKNTISCP